MEGPNSNNNKNVNLEFFQSGKFADAQIECDGRTWAVHRVIMSSRSKWFAKAFGGGFKEYHDMKVTLHEMSSSHIDWLLRYIYGKDDVFNDTVDLDANKFVALCEPHRLGDYFDIPCLRRAAMKMVYSECAPALEVYQLPNFRHRDIPFENIAKMTESAFFSQFFAGISKAYEFEYATSRCLQQAFVGVFKASGYHMLTRPDFAARISDHPQFALPILQLLSSDFTNASIALPNNFPEECDECHRTLKHPAHWVSVDNIFNKFYANRNRYDSTWTEGVCLNCWEPDEYGELDEEMSQAQDTC
ncbi:hypothetical protein PG995_013280 [Apiospora arundinis]